MAVVPDDEIGTVQQDAIPGRAVPHFSDETSPADFGAGLGQGLEQAANDVGQVNSQQRAQAKQAQAKANQDADRVQLAGAITSLSQTRDQIQFGKDDNDPNAAYRQSGKAIVDMPERYGTQFDDAAQEISSHLTPHQQSMFSERISSEKDSLDLGLRRYQFEQAGREATETFSNAKTQSIQSASNNYRDPDATPQAREDLFNAGMALATRGGKDQIEAYQQSGYAHDLDQLHDGVVGAYLSDNNIRGAQQYLNQWAPDLSSGAVKDTLENRIRAAADRLDALNKDTSRDRIADQRAAAMAGLPGWEKLAAPGDYQTVHKGDAEVQQALTQKMAQAGASEKEFDQMTPAAVQSAVDASKPTVATSGVAQDLEMQRFMEQAAKRSLDRRREDPAAFAIDSGKGWQPIDFTDPQAAAVQLRSRSQTAPDIATQIGVRMPLLSKPEAAQLSQQLDAQSPAQKLQALTGLHAALPNERAYFSVLNQVAQHSPVTAIVGQKIDRPNEWDVPSWYNPANAPSRQDGERILAGEAILNPPRGKGQEGEERGSFKDGFPMPPEDPNTGLRASFANATKGVFNDRPQLADAHYSAVRDAYAALSSEAGDYSGKLNSARAKQAIQIGVGKSVDFNGSNVVPPNGMDPSTLQSTVQQTVAATAKAAGAPADWEQRIKGYQLRERGSVGSGRYELVNGNIPLVRPDGKGVFIIDLQAQHEPQ